MRVEGGGFLLLVLLLLVAVEGGYEERCSEDTCEFGVEPSTPIALSLPTYLSFSVEPMLANLTWGVRVKGINVTTGLSRGMKEEIKEALIRHQLLIFEGTQDMKPEDQIRFSSMWGDVEPLVNPEEAQIPGFERIFVVSNNASIGYSDIGRFWHNDGSMRKFPSIISMWRMVMLPEEGGDTLFANQRLVWEHLTPEQRAEYETLAAVHSKGEARSMVWKHPLAGDPMLTWNHVYDTVGFVPKSALVGKKKYDLITRAEMLDEATTQRLLRQLRDSFADYENGVTYTHKWKAGELIVAENFSIMHHATECILREGNQRVLHRTSVHSHHRTDLQWYTLENSTVSTPSPSSPPTPM